MTLTFKEGVVLRASLSDRIALKIKGDGALCASAFYSRTVTGDYAQNCGVFVGFFLGFKLNTYPSQRLR